MDSDPDEVPLTGGRITPGVVRVGDTVRRPATSASPLTAALLRHLEQQGFAGAPRYLGRDHAGRDVLSYMPGWVPSRFQPWSDAQVAAAGQLLRAFHDATRGSGLASPHLVVCHHDPGPNNMVFDTASGRPYAFIDFDMAGGGMPLEDVGYTAWTFCISSKAGAPSPAAQAAQVRVLADAYGLEAEERSHLIESVLSRQLSNAAWWRSRLEDPEPSVASAEQIAARVDWSYREHAFTATHRALFTAALA